MSAGEHTPTCIGFIMDGNRRWAKQHGLPTFEGHRRGYDTFLKVVELLGEHQIPHAVFYAFSTENWQRSVEEVSYLESLFQEGLQRLLSTAQKMDVCVRMVGEVERFSPKTQSLIAAVEQKTDKADTVTVWVLLSYGGRAEIVDAVNHAVNDGRMVTEASFSELLWTKGMPDPDVIIRTSGEERLSNFLSWQSVYSEFIFTETLWPDFGKEEFQRMLETYGARKRRKGV